jgi:hypothetical protein
MHFLSVGIIEVPASAWRRCSWPLATVIYSVFVEVVHWYPGPCSWGKCFDLWFSWTNSRGSFFLVGIFSQLKIAGIIHIDFTCIAFWLVLVSLWCFSLVLLSHLLWMFWPIWIVICDLQFLLSFPSLPGSKTGTQLHVYSLCCC